MSLPLGLDDLGVIPSGFTHTDLPRKPDRLTPREVEELEDLEAALDHGFKVWRSLPMESDLHKKLKAMKAEHRVANFTKSAKPEAYTPGFEARPGGPISRPHGTVPTSTRRPKQHHAAPHNDVRASPRRKEPVRASDVKMASREHTNVSTTSSHNAGANRKAKTLHNNILR